MDMMENINTSGYFVPTRHDGMIWKCHDDIGQIYWNDFIITLCLEANISIASATGHIFF